MNIDYNKTWNLQLLCNIIASPIVVKIGNISFLINDIQDFFIKKKKEQENLLLVEVFDFINQILKE